MYPWGAQHSEILNKLMNEIFKACTGKTFFDQQYILRELVLSLPCLF